MIFKYSSKQTKQLCECDEKLGLYIKKIGKIEREMQPNLFSGFCMQLISQQISTKVALKIFGRLEERLGSGITPQALLSCASVDGVGLSQRKEDNLRFIAKSIVNGDVNEAQIAAMDSEQAIKTLCTLPGVGVWTAEMILLFTFGNTNILSFGDYGIISGMKKLYGYKDISKEVFLKHKQKYAPNESVASLYLWEIAKMEEIF